MIPKILYTYWGAEKMSFLRYMTYYSFRKFHPDWTIYCYTPTKLSKNITWTTNENSKPYTGEDYFPKLKELDVKVTSIDMSVLGYSNDLPEVHKSDILRLHLLVSGGFWSDNDILFLDNIDDLIEYNKDVLCHRDGYFSVGFFGFLPNSKNNIKLVQNLRSSGIDYQVFGRKHWDKQLKDENYFNLPKEYFYKYDSTKVQNIYKCENINGVKGIHWYAGHPLSYKAENEITHKNFKDYNYLLTNKIGEIYV